MMGLPFVKSLHEGKSDNHKMEERKSRWKGDAPTQDFRSKMFRPAAILQVAVAVLLAICAVFLPMRRTPSKGDVCITYDQPNQVAAEYPNSSTGTLNATLIVIPITMERARQLIPSKYAILEKSLRQAYPQLPKDTYPVLLQAAHDHDVQFRAYNMSIPDFSRVGFEFPFLDLLGDGQTAFRWAPVQLISSSNEMAIAGSQAYGTVVSPATFEPACNAYAWSTPADSGKGSAATTFFRARSSSSDARFVDITMGPATPEEEDTASTGTSSSDAPSVPPAPLAFLEQILNQPAFANGSACDRMKRPFRTSLSAGRFEPVVVRGRVAAGLGPLAADGAPEEWTGVWGVQVATPFVEDNYLDCGTLAGGVAF